MKKIVSISFKLTFTLSLLLSLFSFGCTPKVLVEIPPRINLLPYQTMGIVEFSSNSTVPLNQFTTQKFMSVIQGAQPGVAFLELGSMEQVLYSVNRKIIDPETIRLIGQKHNVNAIFSGVYEISQVKPEFHISEDLSSLSASANVKISMTAKLRDTKSGATLWTKSQYGKWPLAKINKATGKPVSFDLSTPEDHYHNYMAELIQAVTNDFRVHYEKRAVTK